MDPLAVVGAQFDIVDIWPSYMLRDMFLWEPNSRVMKKVGAFMYGNSVRLSDAVAFIMQVTVDITAAWKLR